MTTFRRLVAAIGLIAMGGSANAETGHEEDLSIAGRMMAFGQYCPTQYEELPPAKRELIFRFIVTATRKVGGDDNLEKGRAVVRQAMQDEYAKGFGEKGKDWCLFMKSMLSKL